MKNITDLFRNINAAISAYPLTWFLFLGLVLFFLESGLRDSEPEMSNVIRVSNVTQEFIEERLTSQLGRAPGTAEMDAAINNYINDEVVVREALKLGLHISDEVVRRRLTQTMGYILEGAASLTIPAEDDLRRYYSDRKYDYLQQARITGQHVFFNAERHGEHIAVPIQTALEAIRKGKDAGLFGDPFIQGNTFASRTDIELAQILGIDFANAASQAPLNIWTGPVRSAYGMHIFRIDARTDEKLISYEEVRDRVMADYLNEQRVQEQEAAVAALKNNYIVKVGN